MFGSREIRVLLPWCMACDTCVGYLILVLQKEKESFDKTETRDSLAELPGGVWPHCYPRASCPISVFSATFQTLPQDRATQLPASISVQKKWKTKQLLYKSRQDRLRRVWLSLPIVRCLWEEDDGKGKKQACLRVDNNRTNEQFDYQNKKKLSKPKNMSSFPNFTYKIPHLSCEPQITFMFGLENKYLFWKLYASKVISSHDFIHVQDTRDLINHDHWITLNRTRSKMYHKSKIRSSITTKDEWRQVSFVKPNFVPVDVL